MLHLPWIIVMQKSISRHLWTHHSVLWALICKKCIVWLWCPKMQRYRSIQAFGIGRFHCTYVHTYTVKRFGLLQPHFGHLSCIPFVCMTSKVQGMLYSSNHSVGEKLPSFVKLRLPFRGLITSFQKAYKSAYQLRLFLWCYTIICPWIVAWLHGCGRNSRNVAK